MQSKHVEKEWQKLLRAEEAFLKRNMPARSGGWQDMIAKYVPEKLEDKLNAAFSKAFEVIFDKGTVVIEKTYRKEKKEQDYMVNAYAADVRGTKRSMRAFSKKVASEKRFNQALSAVEGVGMGLLGMGIPDIPLFLGILLRSIYEIAISYGFSYDTKEEQMFILKLIETALSHDKELEEGNRELDQWILSKEKPFDVEWNEQIRRTSDALSKELLYLKFVQGMPVVGIVGGVSDMIYQKKISDFAVLKYKKRFLDARRGS